MMIIVFTINRLYVNYNKSNACMKITFRNTVAETEKARDDIRRYRERRILIQHYLGFYQCMNTRERK